MLLVFGAIISSKRCTKIAGEKPYRKNVDSHIGKGQMGMHMSFYGIVGYLIGLSNRLMVICKWKLPFEKELCFHHYYCSTVVDGVRFGADARYLMAGTMAALCAYDVDMDLTVLLLLKRSGAGLDKQLIHNYPAMERHHHQNATMGRKSV